MERLAAITEKHNVLCNLISSKRTYIKVKTHAPFEGTLDPRSLIFEFVTGFLLRQRQVEMVNEFLEAVRRNASEVKQMIMGAGKTTIVGPLIALMAADGSRRVMLTMPAAPLDYTGETLRKTFASMLSKQICSCRSWWRMRSSFARQIVGWRCVALWFVTARHW